MKKAGGEGIGLHLTKKQNKTTLSSAGTLLRRSTQGFHLALGRSKENRFIIQVIQWTQSQRTNVNQCHKEDGGEDGDGGAGGLSESKRAFLCNLIKTQREIKHTGVLQSFY